MAGTPRILISATASGVGKTTIACGLLRALNRRGLRLCACKCGPDYLDPQFHRMVLGVPSRNLDLFMAGEELVRELVVDAGHNCDLMLLEGAMGYYDGIAQSDVASAYDVARVTGTPTVLVVDARGRALSVAAEVAGYARFRAPSFVAGVILNQASAVRAHALGGVIEQETGVPVLGCLPSLPEAHLEHRHLGLVAAAEVEGLQASVDAVADAVEKNVDLDAFVQIAQTAPSLDVVPRVLPAPCDARPTIAVARDEAFSFYYGETLHLFECLGAQLAFFSPVQGDELPAGAQGLYLGGGYPELHARELSQNKALRTQVRAAVAAGMPTIAECGGFLYLHEELEDDQGTSWPMAGALPGRAFATTRLGRFGYVTLTAAHDGLLCAQGEQLAAHEFHYWESEHPGKGFCARKPQSARAWDCVVSTPTLYAGFPHLYLNGCPHAAMRFVDACAAYGRGLAAADGRGEC